MKIGIIGSGEIGGSLARRLSKLGHQVSIANSRGPGSLADLAAETGAKAVTVHEAARSGDIVFVAIPAFKIADLPKDLFDEVDAEGGAHDRSINLALEACAFFEIPEAEAREMIRTMAQRVSDGWREAFRQVGVSGALARDYEGAFVGDEMETARSF